MKRVAGAVYALIILSCVLTFARADSIVGTGSFQSFTMPGDSLSTLSKDSSPRPYWDNPSLDGPNANVGNFISGTGRFAGNVYSPHEDLSYYANDDGSAANDFTFSTGGGVHKATLVGGITAYRNVDEFGWYSVTGSMYNPPTLHVLFSRVLAGSTALFNPAGDYGFFMRSGNGSYYFLQSEWNPFGEQSHQHFAAFSNDASTYWIGMEDLAGIHGFERNGDFNDMIVEVSSATPEPSAVSLVVLGLAALFAFDLRRRRRAPTR